jgi:Zn-dependent protease with chaperone function
MRGGPGTIEAAGSRQVRFETAIRAGHGPVPVRGIDFPSAARYIPGMMNPGGAFIEYPPPTSAGDPRAIRPGAAYRKKAARALLELLWFVVVYVFLVSLAATVAAGLCYLGVQIILMKGMWITLAVGSGIASIGVMVLMYLLKFIFMRWSPDLGGTIEVSADDQPELVGFIHRVAAEAKVRRPKRIVIGPEVNAAVYYSSGFWSLFFPVRKNLRIGLGLLNGVSIGEFKAVLAHEFGHFSQGSMRVGSYFYIVNRVIFNLVYDNGGYERALEGWGSASAILSFFNKITVEIVATIQSNLRKVYAGVYRAYMGLSREMEFHADAIASSIAGSEQSVSALHRIALADLCYNSLRSTYGSWAKGNVRPDDFFLQHHAEMSAYAVRHGFGTADGSPDVKGIPRTPLYNARIVLEDAWSSHPSLEERELRHRALNIQAVIDTRPATVLLKDGVSMQKAMTQLLFPFTGDAGAGTVLSHEAFDERRRLHYRLTTLPGAFKGFYDRRYPSWAGPPAGGAPGVAEPSDESIDAILDHRALDLVTAWSGLNDDLARLKAIDEDPGTDLHFIFDGNRRHRDDARVLRSKFELQIRGMSEQLVLIDDRLLRYFYAAAGRAGRREEFSGAAEKFYRAAGESRRAFELVDEITDACRTFTRVHSDEPDAVTQVDRIEEFEKALKPILAGILGDELREAAGDDHFQGVKGYCGAESTYLLQDEGGNRLYSIAALEELWKSLISVRQVAGTYSLMILREFLDAALRTGAR